MDRITVLIVEDEPEFLRSFCESVAAEPSLQLLGAVTTRRACMALLEDEIPDVLVVDLGLPDGSGVDLIRFAVRKRPDCDPLVVTVFGDDIHVIEAIEAGATGYLLKGSPPAELLRCIRDLRAGGSPISPSIARRLLERMRLTKRPANGPGGEPDDARLAATRSPANRQSVDPRCASDAGPLTPREVDILRLVAKGLQFADIGAALGLSPHTIVAHVKKIYRKLSVHSRGEAVFEATQMGLL